MSIIDKVVAAVTPPESDEARLQARATARSAARPGSWLELALDHHLEIEAAFAAVKGATAAPDRIAAQKKLALVLTGHSIAEESVLYPALALSGEKVHAEKAYLEQSAAKIQMAALDQLDPTSQDYLDKLAHIEGAVAHHVYEEENTWFLELLEKASASTQSKLALRYREEFNRYCGQSGASSAISAGASSLPMASVVSSI